VRRETLGVRRERARMLVVLCYNHGYVSQANLAIVLNL